MKNVTFAMSGMRLFNGFSRTNYEFCTFWPIQNATWTSSRKQCCKWSPDPWYTFSLSECPNTLLCLGRESDDSRGCLALTRNIRSSLSKMQHVRRRERNVCKCFPALCSHFRLLAIQKKTLATSRNRWFIGLPVTNYVFYTLWRIQNATWPW